MVQQVVFNQLGYFGLSQTTLASAAIEIDFQFNPAFPIVLDPPQVFPFRSKGAWKGVPEAECDELRHSLFITMGQVSAFMPTTKVPVSCVMVLIGGPSPFSLNEIP